MPSYFAAAVSLLLTAVEPSPSSPESPVEPRPPAPLVLAAPPLAAQPPAASNEPAWSIGAGVVFTMTGISMLGQPMLGNNSGPGATVFIEHQRGARSFLVFDLSATYESARYESGANGQARQRSLSADLGVRYVLTPPEAVVDVSLVGLVDGQLADYVISGADTAVLLTSQWNVGLSGGVAVERRLAPGLFVRIATPVVYASYGRSRIDYADMGSRVSAGFGAGLKLAPRLELRLAF